MNVIVLYVVGSYPTIARLERLISNRWNMVEKPKIYYHNEGYFVVKFMNLADRNKMLYLGPQMMNNRPIIIIKAWTSNFEFAKEVLKTIPFGQNSRTCL